MGSLCSLAHFLRNSFSPIATHDANDTQHRTQDTPHDTHQMTHAMHNTRRATQDTPCDTHQRTHTTHHSTHDTRHTSRHTPKNTHNIQHTTRYATHKLQPTHFLRTSTGFRLMCIYISAGLVRSVSSMLLMQCSCRLLISSILQYFLFLRAATFSMHFFP